MTDVFSRKKRSEIMSHVKSRDTAPEKAVRSLLRRMGYRLRLHVRTLPGSPDIVIPRLFKAIFVHGCVWHGHRGCLRARLPATNTAFWEKKIAGNTKRDRRVIRALHMLGWQTLVIWQCQLRDKPKLTSKTLRFLSR